MRILVTIPDEWVPLLDKKRGIATRTAWIRHQLEPAITDRRSDPQTEGASSSGKTAESKSANGGSIPSAPAKDPKACPHTETVFKVGRKLCVKCGEFV
jgi:hypothetical protein